MKNTVVKKTTISTGVNRDEQSQTVEYIIYFLFGLLEILLVFRLLLKLSGANPVSDFVSFIYTVTQIFIVPFAGIFSQATATGLETTAIFEPANLVAIIIYAFLAWGITQIVVIMSGRFY